VKRKRIKAEVLLVVSLLLISAGAGGVFVRPVGEPDQVIESRMGDVIWNHDYHARMEEVGKCITCHHEMPKTEKFQGKYGFGKAGMTSAKACRECHQTEDAKVALINGPMYGLGPYAGPEGKSDVWARKAFHDTCMGCHKALEKGPVRCRDCHMQRAVGDHGLVTWDHREHSRFMNMECEECHHKAEEDFTDGDYRPCDECHPPLLFMDLTPTVDVPQHETVEEDVEFVHGECEYCHIENNPMEGAESCQECHIDLAPVEPEEGEEGEAPSLEVAIHQRCLPCHNTEYEDLDVEMPAYCEECHLPNPNFLPGGEEDGPVVWSHKRHTTMVEWGCNECHHDQMEVADPEPHMACRRCHGQDDLADAPTLEDALHKKCVECHGKEMVFTGPRRIENNCKACHFKNGIERYTYVKSEEWEALFDHRLHAESLAFACRDCHHNSIRREGLPFTVCKIAMVCPTLEAGAPQSCKSCHDDDGIGELGHRIMMEQVITHQEAVARSCQNCHDELDIPFPEEPLDK